MFCKVLHKSDVFEKVAKKLRFWSRFGNPKRRKISKNGLGRPLGAPKTQPKRLHESFANFSALRACHRPRFAKFSRKFREFFFENVGAKIFSKNRSRRRDQFGPKIVKIRAILAIFEPFEVLGCQKNRIFGRPFTPRGWLRSASNFGKTRFRRSPTFHLSMPKMPSQIFLVKF